METRQRNIWYAIVNATETERLNNERSAEISDNENGALFWLRLLHRTEQKCKCVGVHLTHLSQISFKIVHLTYLKINVAANAYKGGNANSAAQ